MADSSFQSVNGLPINYQQMMMNNQNIVVSPTPPPVMDFFGFETMPNTVDQISPNINQGSLQSMTGDQPLGNLTSLNTVSDTLMDTSQSTTDSMISWANNNTSVGQTDWTVWDRPKTTNEYLDVTDRMEQLYYLSSVHLSGQFGATPPELMGDYANMMGFNQDIFLARASMPAEPPQKLSDETKGKLNSEIVEIQNAIAKAVNVTDGPRGWAELVNPCKLFGLNQEGAMLQKRPVRDKIISVKVITEADGKTPKPVKTEDGRTLNNVFKSSEIGPEDFAAIHDEMIDKKVKVPGTEKQLMYGNCAEQAGFLMAELLKKIKDNPKYAGVKAQQVWVFKNGQDKTLSQSNHSYVMVYLPGEDTPTIYDPWYVNQSGFKSVDSIKKFYPEGWDKDKDNIVVTPLFP